MLVQQEIGTVIDTYNSKARVKIARKSECNSCRAVRFCGMLNQQFMVLEALNPIKAERGQQVVVKLGVESELKATLILYFIPLMAFLVGTVLGYEFHPFKGNSTLSALILSFLFLFLSFVGIKLYNDKIYKTKAFYTPVITEILEQS